MEKRIYIRVPEQLLKEFDRACKANYTTKSEVLRRAMLEYVRETKKEDVKLGEQGLYEYNITPKQYYQKWVNDVYQEYKNLKAFFTITICQSYIAYPKKGLEYQTQS
jgi:metal-responsive CopG/Arc/MetJ family transcriptional regulator